MDDTIRLATLTLEREMMAVGYRIPAHVADSAQFHTYVDDAARHMVMELHAMVTGLKQAGGPQIEYRTFEFKAPATWWDAFKLAAIEAGNPFFDPDKVRYRTERKTWHMEVTPKRLVTWPNPPTFPNGWGPRIEIPLAPDTRMWLEG